MLFLYHLTNSRSQRIVWLLTALQVDFQLIFVEPTKTGEAPESLKSIHPLGKVPILVIEDPAKEQAKKIIIAETSAIIDYLSVKFLQHPLFDYSQNLASYCYYKNFADSSLMPNLALKQIFSRLVDFSPFFAKPISKAIKQGVDSRYLNPTLIEQLAMIDKSLREQDFLAGEYLTVADILMWFMLLALSISMPNFENFSHIKAYLQRIENLPSYQMALAKGKFDIVEFQLYWTKAW